MKEWVDDDDDDDNKDLFYVKDDDIKLENDFSNDINGVSTVTSMAYTPTSNKPEYTNETDGRSGDMLTEL